MVSETDIHKRVRILSDVGSHRAGEECTIIEIIDGRMMLEFDDHDWGVVVPPHGLDLVEASADSAA